MKKFLLIKDLPADGMLTASWIAAMRESFDKHPTSFRQDYDNLVQTIADLHVIEAGIRTKVLMLAPPSTDTGTSVVETLPKLLSGLSEAVITRLLLRL